MAASDADDRAVIVGEPFLELDAIALHVVPEVDLGWCSEMVELCRYLVFITLA